MTDRSSNLGKYLHPRNKAAAKVRSAKNHEQDNKDKKAAGKAVDAKLKGYKNPSSGGVRG